MGVRQDVITASLDVCFGCRAKIGAWGKSTCACSRKSCRMVLLCERLLNEEAVEAVLSDIVTVHGLDAAFVEDSAVGKFVHSTIGRSFASDEVCVKFWLWAHTRWAFVPGYPVPGHHLPSPDLGIVRLEPDAVQAGMQVLVSMSGPDNPRHGDHLSFLEFRGFDTCHHCFDLDDSLEAAQKRVSALFSFRRGGSGAVAFVFRPLPAASAATLATVDLCADLHTWHATVHKPTVHVEEALGLRVVDLVRGPRSLREDLDGSYVPDLSTMVTRVCSELAAKTYWSLLAGYVLLK
jgi:hypothetical protein